MCRSGRCSCGADYADAFGDFVLSGLILGFWSWRLIRDTLWVSIVVSLLDTEFRCKLPRQIKPFQCYGLVS